jgi:hypothetical protein
MLAEPGTLIIAVERIFEVGCAKEQIGLAVPIQAQQTSALPNSGTFKIHSAWKGVGETIKVGDNHLFGAGTFWRVAFNDTGSGPLHMGPVVCPYTLETMNGAGAAQGVCAWSDADGDKIFNTYSGKISPSGAFDGVNVGAALIGRCRRRDPGRAGDGPCRKNSPLRRKPAPSCRRPRGSCSRPLRGRPRPPY